MTIWGASRAAMVAAVLALGTATAWGAEPKPAIDLPAQDLGKALEALATQAHIQVLYSADLVSGLKGQPVKGNLAPADALRAMLAGTGLEAAPTVDGAFAITRAPTTGQLAPVEVPAYRDEEDYRARTATVGGKTPIPVREIANSVSVLTRERMDDQGWTDVDHALSWATGVDTRSNDGSQSQYYSRGFALGVMYDGMPAYDALSGYQQFDLAMYDRIEVLRGPSGLMQGSEEPAGSVNLVRKRPTDKPMAAATASIGSWNQRRTTADVSTPITADGTLKGRFVGAFTDRDFFYDNAHEQKWMGYGILEYTPTPDWTFSYSSTYQKDHYTPFSGVPVYSDKQPVNFSRSTNTMADWSWAEWATHEEKADAEHRFANGWTAKVAGSWREQSQSWKDGFPGAVNRATNTANYLLRDREFTHYRKAVDAYVDGPFRLFGREHNLLLGTNVDVFNTNGSWGTNKSVPNVNVFNPSGLTEPNLAHTNGKDTRITQYGEYGQVRFRAADPLLLIVGGRNTSFDADVRSMSSSRWSQWQQDGKAKNEFTPYAAAVLDVTRQTSVYGSYSEIFVPQTEQTSSGSVLPPRKGWQVEVGVKNELLDGKLQANVAAFVLRDTNRAITDPSDTDFSIAAGEVESKGWEAEITGSPVQDLKLSAGYTYLITQYVNSEEDTGNTFSTWEPRHSLKLWGVYSFGDGPMEGWSFGGGVIAKSQTYTTQHQAHQNAYAVVDAEIGYRINEHLSATLNANNIFDNDYWDKLLSPSNNYYGEPRNFMLTLKAEM